MLKERTSKHTRQKQSASEKRILKTPNCQQLHALSRLLSDLLYILIALRVVIPTFASFGFAIRGMDLNREWYSNACALLQNSLSRRTAGLRLPLRSSSRVAREIW